MAILPNHSKKINIEYFTELIENNKLRFYKTAKAILKSDDDVYDVLQEALLSIYNNYKNLKNKEHFTTWATRIVINKCYDFLRANKKNNTVDINEIADTDTKNAYYDEYEDDKYGIKKAINHLSEDQKIVVILYYYNNYSVKEISEIIKVPEGTVKSRLSKAREVLKNQLEKEEI